MKLTFLHGELLEDIYIDQPLRHVKEGSEKKVHKLKKALYKLKQAPRAWYSCIKAYFDREGLLKYPHEHTLFTKFSDNGLMLIMYLYVDDLRYTRNNCD